MTALVFVDANVFLYGRDEDEPEKRQRANAWLDHLWRERLGRTSVQVLSEFYVNLMRKSGARLSRDNAWDVVEKYFAWAPQPVDEPVFRRARDIELRYKLSWWDSLVVAAAQLQDCYVLLTEDLQDGMAMGPLIVRSPFTLAVGEPAAAYAVVPTSVSRHRPRGRPRRLAQAA